MPWGSFFCEGRRDVAHPAVRSLDATRDSRPPSYRIAAGGLAWYGVRTGLWWARITGVIVRVAGLAVALPLHNMGHFNY